MSELCEHSGREDDRPEYCEQEAADPYGDLAVMTELIDALLYEKGDAASDDFMLSTNGKLLMVTRTVTLDLPHPDIFGAFPLNFRMSLTHQVNKELASEHYGVETSWRIADQSMEGNFVMSYFMDIFPNGRVQTSLEAPDLVYGGREERPLTGYDYAQLFNDLTRIYDLEPAE